MPALRRRLRWLIVAVVAGFLFLAVRLGQLQILRGERYYARALSNVMSQRYLPALRGDIVDRNGGPLAKNRPAFSIYARASLMTAAAEDRLGRLLGLSDKESLAMRERVGAARKRSPNTPVMILNDQGRDRAAIVEQSGFLLPGVSVRDVPYRFYPNGTLAAHLVGYMNKMTAAELDEHKSEGATETELIGRYGLEKEWETYLRGKQGIERFVVNAKGRRVAGEEAERLIEGPRYVRPLPGHNVVLTLDIGLQNVAEAAVAMYAAAAVVVVEVETGRLLAMVSTPSFDPNTMTGHLSRQEERLMLSDPRKPFIDKTLHQHYPPGSTYKFVTAVAALEDGAVGDDEILTCSGQHEVGKRTFHCTSSHGEIRMLGAIQRSCNVYFWKLAERIGIDRMAEVAADFGFGTPTGLGLNGDVPGRVPTRAWYEAKGSFKVGYTLNAATGQGDVEVTPTQLAMAYAAMANGGKLLVPQVVRRIETKVGDVVIEYEPRMRRRIRASPETLDVLREGMKLVVNEKGGTAYAHAFSEQVQFAGKTGTAQVRGRQQKLQVKGWHPFRDHAWFAGYAPVDAPEIAIVVLIEHGGPGGKVAAPVARRIIEAYFRDKQNTRAPSASVD